MTLALRRKVQDIIRVPDNLGYPVALMTHGGELCIRCARSRAREIRRDTLETLASEGQRYGTYHREWHAYGWQGMQDVDCGYTCTDCNEWISAYCGEDDPCDWEGNDCPWRPCNADNSADACPQHGADPCPA